MFEVGEIYEVDDMYGMVSYPAEVYSIVSYDLRPHLILLRNGRYSLGQVGYAKKGRTLCPTLRATVWFDSIDKLCEHWKKVKEIENG